MTTVPLTDEQLAAIRERFERVTLPYWRETSDIGRLLAELDRTRAELAAARQPT